MTDLSFTSLEEIDAAWHATPESRPGAVSDGDHIFRVDAYRVEQSKAGNPMIYAEIVAVGGPDAGTMVKRYSSLKDNQAVGRYKAELRDIGIDTNAPSFSVAGLINSGYMIGKHIVGKAKNTPDKNDPSQNNCNIRLVRFATEADLAGVGGGQAGAGAGAPQMTMPGVPGAPTQPQNPNPWPQPAGAGVAPNQFTA